MSIKSFLDEVRFKTYTTDVDIPYDRTNQSHSFIMCQLRQALIVADDLKGSTEYSLNSYHDIRKDIAEIFNKIEDKIEVLSRLAEGYQYLNTNEFDNDTIHDMQVFKLTDKVGYNDITKSLTLPRLNKVRELRPTTVKKENINAEELYKLQGTYRDSLIGITCIEETNTQIIKADLLDDKKNLLLTVLPTNGRVLHKLPEEVKYVLVHTNNADKVKSYYTTLSILENRYEEQSTLVLGEGTFSKAGDIFKLVIDSKVPTEAHMVLELKVSYTNKYTKELEEYTLYVNGITSRHVLVDKNTVKGRVLDLNGNEVDVENTLNEHVLVKEFSTQGSTVKHLGNKVFDISGIKADSFNVVLKVSMYSTVDNTKTPEIKGVFAYVTEK